MRLLFGVLATLAVLAVAERAAPERLTALGLAAERAIGGLSLHEAQVDGFTLPYLDGGSGDVLVLLHGFGGDKDNFTRIARHLTPHYRVIVPDLPGFGDASRDPARDYAMADQVARVHALLGQLGIRRAHLGGNSMGGFIAAQYAATYPDAVASVWLLDPGGTAQSYDTALLRHYRDTGVSPLLARHEGDIENMIAMTTHEAPLVPKFARVALGRRAVADFALHTRIMRQMQSSPLLERRYAAIAAPALIVWGKHDRILNPAAASGFAALFPNSRVRLMDGVGHLPMLEAPDRTAADYLHYRRTLPN